MTTTIYIPIFISKEPDNCETIIGTVSFNYKIAVNSLINHLVGVRLVSEKFYDMHSEESKDSIFKISQEECDEINENDQKYIEHIIEFVNGDFKKLEHYCYLLGDSYFQTSDKKLNENYSWTIRIDQKILL
jgi:hypothetical protein